MWQINEIDGVFESELCQILLPSSKIFAHPIEFEFWAVNEKIGIILLATST